MDQIPDFSFFGILLSQNNYIFSVIKSQARPRDWGPFPASGALDLTPKRH